MMCRVDAVYVVMCGVGCFKRDGIWRWEYVCLHVLCCDGMCEVEFCICGNVRSRMLYVWRCVEQNVLCVVQCCDVWRKWCILVMCGIECCMFGIE